MVKKRKSNPKPQVMPPYGKMKSDGHTSVKDVQDTGYQTVPKPAKRPVPSKMIKSKHKSENTTSKKKMDIEGDGRKDVDKKSRRIPATMDSKLSSIVDKSGFAKKNKDVDKQPKMK